MLSLMPPSIDTYVRTEPSSMRTGLTVPTVYRVSPAGPTIARPGSMENRGSGVPRSCALAATDDAMSLAMRSGSSATSPGR